MYFVWAFPNLAITNNMNSHPGKRIISLMKNIKTNVLKQCDLTNHDSLEAITIIANYSWRSGSLTLDHCRFCQWFVDSICGVLYFVNMCVCELSWFFRLHESSLYHYVTPSVTEGGALHKLNIMCAVTEKIPVCTWSTEK